MSYPKIQAYIHWNKIRDSEHEKKQAAKCDLILSEYLPPDGLAELRTMNPGLRFAQVVHPYMVPMSYDRGWTTPPHKTWWWKTLAWSPYYAQILAMIHEPNWFLSDASGHRIHDDHHYFLNWTSHCPPGKGRSMPYGLPPTYGKRVSQWMVEMIAHYAHDWLWDVRGECTNALMLELLGWNLHHLGVDVSQADPENKGQACGIEELSEMMARESGAFWLGLRKAYPDLIIMHNDDCDLVEPDGMKLENFMNPDSGMDWIEWWEKYKFLDDIGASEHSAICHTRSPHSPRLALGTALLLDGYFQNGQSGKAEWFEEMEYKIGQPTGGYLILPNVSTVGPIYARLFERGLVVVNPNTEPVAMVPAMDAVIRRWE